MKHDEEIHKLIKEKFGSNKLGDEKFTTKKYSDYEHDNTPKNVARGFTRSVGEYPSANPDVLSDEVGGDLLPVSQRTRDAQNTIKNNRKAAIRDCRLTPNQRAIINYVGDGLTHAEIAVKLNVQRAAVSNAFRRAESKILAYYRKNFSD